MKNPFDLALSAIKDALWLIDNSTTKKWNECNEAAARSRLHSAVNALETKGIKNPFDFPAEYLDNGHWQISEETALKLVVELPKWGHSKLIQLEPETKLLLSRTVVDKEMVWCVKFY
jgi:hypothetical protein